MRRGGRIILLLLTVLVVLRLGQMAVWQTYHSPGIGQHSQDLIIPAGGSAEVAARLQQAGVIAHPLLFRAAAFVTRDEGPLRAGEYEVPAHAGIAELLALLRRGKQVEHQVTIPEGLTSGQVAGIVNALPLATGHVAPPAEGSVLPQTYDYLWNTPRRTILHRAEAAMTRALTAAWAKRAPDLPLATPEDALTLASIVQAEAKLTAEMPRIASVYENRLRRGMMLQADPTVIFAQTGGTQVGGASISRADLENSSPYNTYVHAGLPPGPICSPGIAAIDAVLHPAKTDDLYFVANGTGGHTFSRDFQQQLQAIKKFFAGH